MSILNIFLLYFISGFKKCIVFGLAVSESKWSALIISKMCLGYETVFWDKMPPKIKLLRWYALNRKQRFQNLLYTVTVSNQKPDVSNTEQFKFKIFCTPFF